MSKRPARSKQAMNPLVTLRAKTIPSKKKVASKAACRKTNHRIED